MRRARLIPLSFLFPPVLGAQVQASIDAGLSRLEQAGLPASAAQSLGLNIDGLTSRVIVRSSALATHAADQRWTGQAAASASLFGVARQPVKWELTGLASVFGETGAQTAASGELMARAHIIRSAF